MEDIRLVRTKMSLDIKPRIGLYGVVYFRLGDVLKSKETGVTVIPVSMSVLKIDKRNEIKQVNNNGVIENIPIVMCRPRLENFEVIEAVYKTTTFESATALNNPKTTDLIDMFPSAVERITLMWENESWTGNEIQKPRYWNLKASDIEILTEAQTIALMTPYEEI